MQRLIMAMIKNNIIPHHRAHIEAIKAIYACYDQVFITESIQFLSSAAGAPPCLHAMRPLDLQENNVYAVLPYSNSSPD